MTSNPTEQVPTLYTDPRIPAVRTALASQQGSTWPTIPWNSPTSWTGWMQCPLGLEYHPAVTSSGPAKWARWTWSELPNKSGDFYLVGAATYNTILTSTFASPAVMRGFTRAVKAVTGVRI